MITFLGNASLYDILFYKCNLCVHIERNSVINKHNQILLNRLVDISHGKWLSVQPKNRASETFGPRSLNVVARKRENERIERENHAYWVNLYFLQFLLQNTFHSILVFVKIKHLLRDFSLGRRTGPSQ